MLTGNGVTKRLVVPHEDGEWVDIRVLSWRQMEVIRKIDDEAELAFAFLKEAIVAWSYEEPVSDETINRLDGPTATFIVQSLMPTQEADRKNDSDTSTKRSSAKPTTLKSGS